MDQESNFSEEYQINNIHRSVVKTNPSINCNFKKPEIILNEYPENDNMKYGKSKVCPGNITSLDKKVIIFSDSICQRIRLKEFNSFINYGHADKKCFPVVTPKELLHYCLPSLIERKPDEVIIRMVPMG